MNILVVNNMAPFIWGGAEELAVHLQKNIVIAGHQSEILRIPFQWEPATGIPAQMLLVRALELSNVDQVIVLKFPAYLIRHPNKTFWLLHQYRQAYDLFDTDQTNLPAGPAGAGLRNLIKAADKEAFTEAKSIFTNSEVTRQRLLRFNGFDAAVLLPPVNDPGIFSGGHEGNYIFAGGRINDMKRQHLLLSALSKTSGQIRLVIAGPPDTPSDGEKLRGLVQKFGLADRVHLDLQFLPRDAYAAYLRQAAAVAYLPFDEDSLGYVAMEAATAGKALISTTDSGGILGLVKHLETGWVAEPTAEGLCEAMSNVFKNPSITRSYGQAVRELWADMGITWPKTVERLLA